MILNLSKEDQAHYGVCGVLAVTLGSVLANTFTAADGVADAYGGWTKLDFSGFLSALLNAALSIGSEVVGLFALGFAIAGAIQWARGDGKAAIAALAAIVVFIASLFINGHNTHAFVMGQARHAAEQKVKATQTYQEFKADAEKALPPQPAISPAALKESLKGMERDRATARADGRWADVKEYDKAIRAQRDALTAATSLQINYDAAKTKRENAQAEMDSMLAGAKPDADAEAFATTTMIVIEVIKALGVMAFMGEAAAEQVAAKVKPRRTKKPAADLSAEASAKAEKTPAPNAEPKAEAPKAEPRKAIKIVVNNAAKRELTADEKRARNAQYNRDLRARKKLAAQA